jgi:peptide/nickel transport system substrate-binding protein
VRSVPDESTRLAMLKRGEADVSYLFRGALAEELRRSPGLTLRPYYLPVPMWLVFTEQWDPKSPWADRRVRLAANLAIDRQSINQAETLGLSKLTASIIPQRFDFYWPAPLYPYDVARARQLLAEAGYPNGFDAGDLHPWPPYNALGEAVTNYLSAVGIRTRVRSMERAAFYTALASKKLKGVCLCINAVYGNAASRLAQVVPSDGAYAYGADPDIDALYKAQGRETDRKKREALLRQLQQTLVERVRYAPLYDYVWPSAVSTRVEDAALMAIDPYPWSAPVEDVRLRKR